MEARSYVENIANRTTMVGVVDAMSQILTAVCLIGGVLLAVLTGFHPAATVIGGVLVVLSLVFGRDALRLARQRRAAPLDLAFEPAPSGGLVSAVSIYAAAGTVAAFVLVFALLAWLMGSGDSGLPVAAYGLAAAAALALVGLPTLGVERRKWDVLRRELDRHPEMIAVLQDARTRFPDDAPFPFSAPTDRVTIP